MSGKWKIAQSRRKRQKKIKLALVTGAVVGLLFLAGALLNLTKTLNSPWQLQAEKNYFWDIRYNINVAVRGTGISLISFNPFEKTVLVIKLPPQTYLDVPGGFGKWQLRSVYDLEKSGFAGADLLERTLTSFLAAPVEGFIQLKEGSAPTGEEYVARIRQNPLNIALALKDVSSDLSLLELVRLNLALFQARFDKVRLIDFESAAALNKINLPDQTEVLIGDPVRVDSVISALADKRVIEEHQTVAVFNATERPLIAQKAARIIANLGGNVIQVSNSSRKLETTVVFGQESETLKRLKQIFGFGIIDLDPAILSSRAQINVVLGEDFAKQYQ
ncbi:LytR C-terminal domain-containing protein [Candidatus Daviesbacteria bacterium]|nr:LytR C-terminal domain-containing protein [Candidatus Daviesbacteria bacterium]